MRYFITGGLGAIGSTTARYLVEKGNEIIVYDINPHSTNLLKDIIDKIKIVEGDVYDLPCLVSAIKNENVNYVVHMAAILDIAGQEHPIKNIKTNIIGAMNVFEACKILGLKRVVYCSTRGVFRQEPQGRIPKLINEDWDKNPEKDGKLYSISKLYGEHLAETYNIRYGMECVGLRFSATFGLGKKSKKHGYFAIISQMIENAIKGIPIIIPKGGEQHNDYVYYKDIAQAIELACNKKNLKHFIFNISSGATVSLFDVGKTIKLHLPEAKIRIGRGIDFLNTGGYGYSAFDTTQARKELGYKPRYLIKEAIKDYIETIQILEKYNTKNAKIH